MVNMIIKQIILTKSIPFEIKLNADPMPEPQTQAMAFEDAFDNFTAGDGTSDPVIEGIKEEYME